MYRRPSTLATNAGKYCSRACRNRAHPHTGKRTTSPALLGANNHAWRGGVTYWRKHGNYPPIKYIRCPTDLLTMARKDGYVMEHRVIMARLILRPLIRSEVVHHLNHNPQDNTPHNLELWPDNRSHKLAEHGRIAHGAVCRLSLTE